MKKVVVVGSNGQDGSILIESFEKEENIELCAISRDDTKISNLSTNLFIDINNIHQVADLVKSFLPDEIYYLAAHHRSSGQKQNHSFKEFEDSFKVNVHSYYNFLDSIRRYSPNTKIFYAASSHIFGIPDKSPQDEQTPFSPVTLYGITKLNSLYLSRLFRKKYGLFCSVGILYNHESGYRKENFISKKIVKNAIKIKNGVKKKLIIGNPNVLIDWGYAGDYVEAMKRIMNYPIADEFVVSSGKRNKLSDFIKYVFSYLDLDFSHYLVTDPSLLIRTEISNLYGNPTKLMKNTRWKPKLDLKQLAEYMVEFEWKNIS